MKYLLSVAICFIFAHAVFSQPRIDVKKSLAEAANFMQTGNFAGAEKILLQVKKSAPTNPDVYNLLGIIFDQKGEFTKAEIEYRTAIRLNPKAISPLANLGILLAKSKREKEAIKTFEAVLKLNPNHPQTVVNLGFLYSSTGSFQNAVDFLTKANQIQPNSPDILFKLGTALYQTKKPAEAKIIFEQLNVTHPTAENAYFLGLIAFDQNNFEPAGQFFETALALNSNFADANFMLGEILSKLKRYPEAVTYYQKAITIDKTKDVYFVRLGGTYLNDFEFEKAFQYFKEASELFPQIAEIKYFLAVTLRGLGNYDEALAVAKKSLALKETADATALIGSMLFDRNDNMEAEKYLRKATILNPNHFNSNHDLGRILVKQQKFADALPILQKAVSLMPNNADIHYQLFLTYSRLKRKAEADQALAIFKQLSEQK